MNIITWDVVHGKLWQKIYPDHELGGNFDLTRLNKLLISTIGCNGVFVGSGIFKSGIAAKRAKAIVRATTDYEDAAVLAEVIEGLSEAMVGINCGSMAPGEKMAGRGW
jgi:pyridoxal 5'-phosphate synthase pdxS subunit